jgi:hypothetical protein
MAIWSVISSLSFSYSSKNTQTDIVDILISSNKIVEFLNLSGQKVSHLNTNLTT